MNRSLQGDLNYRKLVGDRDWPITTPFEQALRGFHPSHLCAMRTLKAETVTGLSQEVADRMMVIFLCAFVLHTRFVVQAESDKKWMVTGDYAVIQYAPA